MLTKQTKTNQKEKERKKEDFFILFFDRGVSVNQLGVGKSVILALFFPKWKKEKKKLVNSINVLNSKV